jgi:glycosyltransferase involved in cell wall biosynthesis
MLISIVTATYNRATTLQALSTSIAAQDMDLEWVVVDDGSTDHTQDLLTDLARQAPFPVRLMRLPHRGKHVALNRGIPAVRGEMVALIDSDDELLPSGLDRLLNRWLDIPTALRSGYVGVTGRCIDQENRLIGNSFPGPTPVDCPWQEAVYVHHARGDRCGVQRADVLRAHPFPEPNGRWFVTEGMVWRQIGRQYLTRYIDSPVLRVHTTGVDRLSRRPFAELAAALRENHAVVLSQDLPWFRHAPALFLGSSVQYVRAGLHERVPLRRQVADLPGPARALWASALPLGAALWLYDRGRFSPDPPADG